MTALIIRIPSWQKPPACRRTHTRRGLGDGSFRFQHKLGYVNPSRETLHLPTRNMLTRCEAPRALTVQEGGQRVNSGLGRAAEA